MDTNGNYIQTQFCSYEIALKLRELGFDKECFKVYDILGFLQIEAEMIQLKLEFVKAPLWQQCLDWLREKHRIEIELPKHQLGYLVHIYKDLCLEYQGDYYIKYYKAREAAILKAIELIKEK